MCAMLYDWRRPVLILFLLLCLKALIATSTSRIPYINFSTLGFVTSSFEREVIAIRLPMSSTSTTATDKYWNREDSKPGVYDANDLIIQEARIIALTRKDDAANEAVRQGRFPKGATLVGAGSTVDEILLSASDSPDDYLKKLQQEIKPNVLYISYVPNASEVCSELLEKLPSIEWIHARSAGIDFITSDTLTSKSKEGAKGTSAFQVTNAKGCFSSTLAEYTLMACAYFAKDLPRLMKQKGEKDWNKYSVLELRGATLGVIGYGDIGRAAAKLAKAYGMKVIALKRKRPATDAVDDLDPYCDQRLYHDKKDSENSALNELFSSSDYVLCSLPLTTETKGMITREHFFDHAKPDVVFVNVGRGPIVDEDAMIEALRSRRIKGAGLDVFAVEPLPVESELWDLDNVLLSPHNMDQTDTFMLEATDFFISENLNRYIRGLPLLNPVDPIAGY